MAPKCPPAAARTDAMARPGVNDGEARGERLDKDKKPWRVGAVPMQCVRACVRLHFACLRACKVWWRSTMPSSSTIRSMSATIPLGPLLRIRAAS